MPRFELPPLKEKDNEDGLRSMGMDEEWMRRVTIPANQEILDYLGIDDDAQVTITGRIVGLRNNRSKDYNDQNIEIEITAVEAYRSDEATESDAMEAEYNS
jgi:hypothetical protein